MIRFNVSKLASQIAFTGHRKTKVSSRTMYSIMPILLLQFLLTFAQGQGHGNTDGASSRTERGSAPTIDDRLSFTVLEETDPGTKVGTLPVKAGFQYQFSDPPSQFRLDANTGEIFTNVRIDRESLDSDFFDLFVESTPVPRHLLQVNITVLDINDNSPVFHPSILSDVSFTETDRIGVQVILETATDKDAGVNGVTATYKIISGNEDGKFRLVIITETSKPVLYLENVKALDREDKSNYTLRISAQDGGNPPKYGYLTVNVNIQDINDNNPLFDQSEYSAMMNETVPPGTSVVQVHATDLDIGANADIDYSVINDKRDQFTVDRKTGTVRTSKTLECDKNDCTRGDLCGKRSCVVTINAKDNGRPNPLVARAYVTVVLIDENDHDPNISFTYNPHTGGSYGTVNEGAALDSLVATVSVTDADDGDNGATTLEISNGNMLGHFKLRYITDKLSIVQVAGRLDREVIGKYNLTLVASDKGTPRRSSTSFLILMVNDINDHSPVFKEKIYEATLSELVPVGSFVAGITATDNDSGINALITYAIVSGNDNDWFKVDEDTGLVTTKHQLDHEKKSRIVLRIRAQDSGATPHQTFTNLTINIQDENDERPKFSQDEYHITQREELRENIEIFTVNAVDNDQGKNGSVIYSLDPSVESEYPGVFTIDPISGRIVSKKKLDREQVPTYVIKVKASDQGGPPLFSYTTINLKLSDINDNAPIFYPVKYFASVSEAAKLHTSVLTVTATDKDEGPYADISYAITSGSVGKFVIDIKTGQISTSGFLDREQTPSYKLTINAYDSSSQAEVSASVDILVTDVKDTPPEFKDASGYSFQVREDADNTALVVGRLVGQVRAVSRDVNSSVTYMISAGDPKSLFTINSASGVMTTAKKVDREETEYFTLTITANGGQTYGTTTVNITILDVNDNAPRFAVSHAEAYVIENWPVGHDVYHASATDPDSGVNSELSYALMSGSSDRFNIHPTTGVVYLNKPVVSVNDIFHIQVRVSDHGTPKKSATMNITIYVTDVNDHTPTFQKTTYEASISESTLLNDRFFQVIAVDSDSGKNGELVYSITKGNVDNKFGIFPDGVMYVAQRLDREIQDNYVLTVTVTDKGFEPRKSSVNVTVHILDANDNRPIFENTPYVMHISENMPPSSYIGTVKATDLDLGPNAEISYKIQGSSSDVEIHPRTGVLTSLKSFDRESVAATFGKGSIVVTIVAADNGKPRLENSALVTINIVDENDEMPKFTRTSYTPIVKENIDVNMPVVKVVATDADVGDNGKVNYSIIAGNDGDKFSIDEYTGQIRVASSLDREVKDTYHLVVLAEDSGKKPKNNTVTVSVSVKDFNDNAPKFQQAEIRVDVLETLGVGEVITIVTATDDDIGNNAVISYAITAGNVDQTFHIDSNSGKIFLQVALDYEARHQYVLNVTAFDLGSPKLSSTVGIVINVRDFNDNAPVFPPSSLVRQITEGIPVNSLVLTVTASDKDSGINGQLRYSIKKQEPFGNHFVVDSGTGQIRTNAEIDREEFSQFKLTVVATDQAVPLSNRRSAQKLVTVIVVDTNDNAPKFVSMDAVTVTLDVSRNSKISTIKAVDPDADLNGIVTYEITGGDTNMFDIDNDKGDLVLKSTLNSNVLIYTLSITARDKGTKDPKGQQTTTSVFTIIVRSNVDNGALFTKSLYSGEIYENEPRGSSITVVSVKDTSARIEYYITAIISSGVTQPRYFQIDKSSGKVTTAQELDRELGYEVFYVEVYAVDRSVTSPKTRSVQVRVSLLDRNDNPPVFKPSSYTETIAEDSPIDYTVITVTAKDSDKQGVVKYSIEDGNDGSFKIDQKSGTITVLKKLNRETRETYDLKVVASDNKQSSYTIVHIKLTDVNDEPPRFLKPIYSFDIYEDTRVGTTVGKVSAIDPDLDNNAEVVYSVVSKWGSDKFNFDSKSGIFTLATELDFEEVHHYVITVRAQDAGSPPLSSTVVVYMNVVDVNDNAPVFEQGSYSKEISEAANIGTSVLTVTATDVDFGKNGEVRYSLIGGDTGQAFTIDPINGTISTQKALDRETQAYYNLVVMATDQAEPITSRHSTSGSVTVYLVDVNDNAPEFLSPKVATVMENTHLGTSVFRVVAVDDDEARNKLVGYSLGPVLGNVFILEPVDGILRVNGDLDREKVPEYKLKVTATDQGVPPMSTTSELVIKVGDENDNSPQFTEKQYVKEIYENIKIGTSLMSVSASDADEDINADVRYSITSGDDNRDFYIDSKIGDISVNKRLDYERKQKYSLTVQARDLGETPRTDTAMVNITIKDINDNAPVFVDSPFKAYVQEHATSLPVHVVKVTAHDADSAQYGPLSYNIHEVLGGSQSLFQVDSASGEIKVHSVLNREERAYYEVIVRAHDSGSPRQTGTGTVQIYVVDINDHFPVFQQSQYVAHVQENMAANTPVVKVTATDQDEGDNALISYSMHPNPGNQFGINSESGQIFTTEALNREVKDEYDLVVMAKDHGTIPKVTTVSVKVIVDDTNDNTPVFDQKVYTIYVRNPTAKGSFVAGVTAQDKDLGVNGQLVYSLYDRSGSTHSSNFIIDSATGVIRSKNNLPFNQNGYTFYARATDKGESPLSNETTVQVLFLSTTSTNFPSFNSGQRTFQLSENVALDHTVTTVSATSPKNSAITYHIAGGNLGQTFSVSSSGAIKVIEKLDFESLKSYKLWIEARDGSSPPLSDYVELSITVKDENDNPPVFVQNLYNASIMEELSPPQMVAQVSATDADANDNARIIYRITNYEDTFQIDGSSGLIRTNKRLDRESVDHYSLIVEAKDQGNPALSSTATVDVQVQDKNDQRPIFTQHFNAKIYESLPIGAFVIKITSTDKDIGQNAVHTYQIISKDNQKFKIDKNSGNVTVAGELDREVKAEYDLQIQATDGAYTATTVLTIFILDVNDNAPQFVKTRYDFDVVEDGFVGQFIGKISATDDDAPCPSWNPYARCPSSEVYYRLKTPSKLFALNTDTGDVTARAVLAYKMTGSGESSPENHHALTAVAKDRGDPQMSSEVSVNIQVQPANKHAPIFEATNYSAAVNENAATGDSVIQVKATDAGDFGKNAEIEYVKTSGTDNNIFIVDKQTGWITTAAPVNGLRDKSYTLVVAARDKGVPPKSSSVNVVIKVSPANLYSPVFVDSDFSASVPENAQIKLSVGQVTASDKDEGFNGLVSYLITAGDDVNQFSIDESDGIIRVAKILDYEKQRLHVLTVTARDRGLIPRQTSKNFTVHITDVNDSPPVFEFATYDAFVAENSPSGTIIFTANATDADTAPNSVTEYSISGDADVMNKFTIKRDTGVIRSQGQMDFEVKAIYLITMTAANPGTALSSSTTLKVHVTGVNEYVPRFLLRKYQFIISESAKSGQVVGTVQASDSDAGDDGVVFYYLVGDSNSKGFVIDVASGVVKISGQLDRESTSTIKLTAMAKNRGPIRGNDTDECEIEISISDANDAPVFSQPRYTGQVAENKDAGTAVVQITATDSDLQPDFRRFEYVILSGNVDNAFLIDKNTGLIKTNTKLDREKLETYNLIAGAVDFGTPKKTGSTKVDVTILDENDNAPYFIPIRPTGNISENRQPNNDVVIDLKQFTHDRDALANQGPYSYTLRDHLDIFSLDKNTGILKTRVQLDREKVPMYELSVEVEDSGVPSQTSTLTLNVKVEDVNDNPSTQRQLDVIVRSYMGIFAGGTIADVRPLDVDIVGDYRCSIVTSTSNQLSIPSGCQLRANRISSEHIYNVTSKGSDGIHKEVLTSSNVHFLPFVQAAVENTVVVRLSSISPSKFLQSSYVKFLQVVTSKFTNGESLSLYGMSSEDDNLDVYLVARKQNGGYMTTANLQSILTKNRASIEVGSGVSIGRLPYNPCLDSPCKNSAECKHSIRINDQYVSFNSPSRVFTAPRTEQPFVCLCARGYTGRTCESALDKCSEYPCKHGGTCHSQSFESFRCDCTPSWTGDTCEERLNICQKQNPCKNGAECQLTSETYVCKCAAGFSGKHCDMSQDICESKPCMNGGRCQPQAGNQFQCKCGFGERGQRCEVSARGFKPLSFMEYATIDATNNHIVLEFATNKQDALLLYNPGNNAEFLSLEIVQGRVRFSFSLKKGNVSRISLTRSVTDGRWYRVEVLRNKQYGSLKLSECPADGALCSVCSDGDSTCHVTITTNTDEHLDISGNLLTVGGVRSFDTVTARLGQLASHDFVGCIRNVQVNNVDLLKQKPIISNHTTEKCHRLKSVMCAVDTCQNGGTCIDEWGAVRCKCADGFMGQFCEKKREPFSFGPNAMVEYKQKESYRRDQLLSQSDSRRRRRSVHSHSVSMNFATSQKNALLFHTTSPNGFTMLHVHEGKVLYTSSMDNSQISLTSGGEITNNYHNISMSVTGRTVTLTMDGNQWQQTYASDVHAFMGLDLQQMTVGGSVTSTSYNGRVVPGFEGCMSEFRLDGETQPFNGSTARFDIVASGSVSSECKALIVPASSFSLVIILVIVFFVIILIGIVVGFLVIRARRRRSNANDKVKENGNKIIKANGLSGNPNDSGRSHGDSGYTEHVGDVSEELINQQHIANEISHGKYNEREVSDTLQRPDIIAPELSVHSSMMNVDGGIDNDAYQEEPPEHYDLENASSIAPSDIDVVHHYRSYRDGRIYHHAGSAPGGRQRPHTVLDKPPRESPVMNISRHSPASYLTRESPIPPNMQKMQSTPLSHSAQPSPLTVNNLARASPLTVGVGRPGSRAATPLNQLSRCQTPNIPYMSDHRASPLSMGHMPVTDLSRPGSSLDLIGAGRPGSSMGHMPVTDLSGPGRPSSRMGIVDLPSHPASSLSGSNASDIGRSNLMNGRPASRMGSRPPSRMSALGGGGPVKSRVNTPTIGLTVEEVERLNARPHTQSLVSTIDAVSTSTDEVIRNNLNTAGPLPRPGPHLLPPDSTSDDSSNDSFTCSEFEYENEKVRNDLRPGTMIFSKLAEIDENDDTDYDHEGYHPPPHSWNGSLSTLLASEDEMPHSKNPSATFNWDYLLNWGPSFEKLVGVFKDIAQLPDDSSDTPDDSNVHQPHEDVVSVTTGPQNSYIPQEEYV